MSDLAYRNLPSQAGKPKPTEYQVLLQEVKALREVVDLLTVAIRRDKINDAWIPEIDAASMLGLAPRTLRRHCRDAVLPIHFRSTNGRNWQFSRKDITAYMNNTSTRI